MTQLPPVGNLTPPRELINSCRIDLLSASPNSDALKLRCDRLDGGQPVGVCGVRSEKFITRIRDAEKEVRAPKWIIPCTGGHQRAKRICLQFIAR